MRQVKIGRKSCLAVFYSSRWLSQIGPTADFDGAAIQPPIFSMDWSITIFSRACLIHCNALWPDWSDVAACSTFLKKVSRLAKVYTA